MKKFSREQLINQSPVKDLIIDFLIKLEVQSSEERKKSISFPITEKKIPSLFSPEYLDQDTETWQLLVQSSEYGWIELNSIRKKRAPHWNPWQNCRLAYNFDAEGELRVLLNRPRVSEYQTLWFQEWIKYESFFSKAELLKTPFSDEALSPEDWFHRFVQVGRALMESPMTAYQIGARFFWGNSKLFKGKEVWLRDLYGSQVMIFDRTILLHAFLPEVTFKGILFLENQDSYIDSSEWPEASELIKIYMQGYKGATNNLFSDRTIQWHFSGAINSEAVNKLKKCWQENLVNLPLYYFGDIDPEGLRIFSQIKKNMPSLMAWQPGYTNLIRQSIKNSHCPVFAQKKGQQIIVETTGDKWLDINVLPLIKNNKWVDQEAYF